MGKSIKVTNKSLARIGTVGLVVAALGTSAFCGATGLCIGIRNNIQEKTEDFNKSVSICLDKNTYAELTEYIQDKNSSKEILSAINDNSNVSEDIKAYLNEKQESIENAKKREREIAGIASNIGVTAVMGAYLASVSGQIIHERKEDEEKEMEN